MIKIEEARLFMQQHGWLAQTPPAFANKLLHRCEIVTFNRGVSPYRMGEPIDGLWGLVSGGFAMETAMQERGPRLMHVFRPGFWFGEMELFAGAQMDFTMTATRKSILLHLRQKQFEDLVSKEPETWRWVGLLCKQHLEIALGVLEDASLRDPGRRIAALLIRLADVRLRNNPEDPQPELDISQEDIAHLATLSRSTVVGYLQQLENAGLIQRSYGRLALLDPARIRKQVAGELD